jgi:leucine dehydrogenase
MFDHPSFAAHERVLWHVHRESGLRAIIALHDTTLGPAAGGLRRWHYANDFAALDDVLRLSKGMTYKNAIAGVPFGGGKAVILAEGDATRAQFHAFGDLVDSLNGCYVTAEDVGVSVADLRCVAQRTRYVSGVATRVGEGDPSPWTARGVVQGIRAAVGFISPSRDLDGLRIGVQGLGQVGFETARLLHEAGASLLAADLDRSKLERAADELGTELAAVDEIASQPMDVFVPCALGGVLTCASVARLQAKVVAGAANNQLFDAAAGAALMRRGILYAPDYVINAGGIISVAQEYLGGGDATQLARAVDRIGERLLEIFERARRAQQPSNLEADQMAERILDAARREVPAQPPLRPVGVA